MLSGDGLGPWRGFFQGFSTNMGFPRNETDRKLYFLFDLCHETNKQKTPDRFDTSGPMGVSILKYDGILPRSQTS